MTISRRLQQLELKIKLNSKQPGCDITLFIVMPEGLHDSLFDSTSYRPTEDEIEKYLKYLKDSRPVPGLRWVLCYRLHLMDSRTIPLLENAVLRLLSQKY